MTAFSLDRLLQSGAVPDVIIRMGIRHLLAQKLKIEAEGGIEEQQKRLMAFAKSLKDFPIAIETHSANEQHYEVPAEFYHYALGKYRKYSSCYWLHDTKTLDDAEQNMLKLTAERAGIQAGQQVLDLGCGWGSFSLWAAENYPDCQFTGFSNSHSQREYIEGQCKARGLQNLKIITANICEYDFDTRFDRIVSIEMFEHMKNYQLLFEKVSAWLKPEGQLFVHVFTHKDYAYHYLDEGEHDWLTRYFFAGGTMPSNNLFHYFQDHLNLQEQWLVNGTHYQKTAEAWLQNMDHHRTEILQIFKTCYGAGQEKIWYQRWRIFFMACAELWGYQRGQEWMVAHYLFCPRMAIKATEAPSRTTNSSTLPATSL